MTAQPAIATGPAKTIDEVIERLTEIIDNSRSESSRLGYFAALYRNVTREVKRGIEAGRFENGERMERLDVNFANRYLAAFDSYHRGEAASRCWAFAFSVAPQWPPIVLQHLFMGMNAHINLDLGAAAAITCPGDQIQGLKHDFGEINNILAAMTTGVQWQLSQVTPLMKLLTRYTGGEDRAVLNWSIERARDFAWGVATRLAPLDPEQMQKELARLDTEVDLLAHLIRSPGIILGLLSSFVRLTEVRSVSRVIEILS